MGNRPEVGPPGETLCDERSGLVKARCGQSSALFLLPSPPPVSVTPTAIPTPGAKGLNQDLNRAPRVFSTGGRSFGLILFLRAWVL